MTRDIRFRAVEWKNPDGPGCSTWAIETLNAAGKWIHYMENWMPVFKPSEGEALAFVDELNSRA